jgi:hypothetical protein
LCGKYNDHSTKGKYPSADEQNLLNEIVVSASRTPEKSIRVPVTLKEWELQILKKVRLLL